MSLPSKTSLDWIEPPSESAISYPSSPLLDAVTPALKLPIAGFVQPYSPWISPARMAGASVTPSWADDIAPATAQNIFPPDSTCRQ